MTAQPPASRRAAGDAAETYLTALSAQLPGPARYRDGIIAELRAGLADATDAYQAAGLPPGEATQAAVREFGEPGEIAAAFRPELAARQSRRTALTLLASGPIVGVLWASAALTSHLGIHLAPPWQWADFPPATRAAVPLFAAAAAVAIWAALFTIAATGRLTRWLPARPRRAPAAAALAGTCAAAADTIILILLASQLAIAPGRLSAAPVSAAAAASLTRLTLARRAARRCLAVRTALT